MTDTNGTHPPRKYRLHIDPPLLNSASPWATTIDDLGALYESPYTGAVTTRTSLLEGFSHDDTIHQYVFHTAGHATPATKTLGDASASKSTTATAPTSTLNTLGYSPFTLSEYLGQINEIVGQRHLGTNITTTKKPFILSVTGTPDEIAMAYALVANAAEMDEDLRLAMEVNLSCPNIKGKPPPAYDEVQLNEYLEAIGDSKSTYRGRMASEESEVRVGVKLPPYSVLGMQEMVVRCLAKVKGEGEEGKSVVDFVTCTNTLGGCLVVDEDGGRVLRGEGGEGVGGLAGSALHPLALGNVLVFRRLLDEEESTRNVLVIGVGGVEDKAGFERMKGVGAGAVGCASAMGRFGVGVFERITKGS